MKITQLKKYLLARKVVKNNSYEFTEAEINILISIQLMNENNNRCSCNTLFKYLCSINRTPYKKTLLKTIQRFKEDDLISITGKGAATNIRMKMRGQCYLLILEKKIRVVRFKKVD